MRRTFCRLVSLAVLLTWAAGGIAAEDTGTPATARLIEYLKAFNSGSKEAVKQFHLDHFAPAALRDIPLENRLARYVKAKALLRSLELRKILSERPGQTYALVRAGGGRDFLMRAVVEQASPYKLQNIFLEAVDDPDHIALPEPKAGEKEFVSAVRDCLTEKARADEFSGVVLVALNDRVVYHEAYGYADRDKKIPNRKDTKFNLGSINKNFTRLAVLQLVRGKKMSLGDPIKKFLPDYPNAEAAAKVTVRHLLEMTSGIGDFFGPRYEETPKEKIRSIRDYLPLFADLPLAFEPGAASRYSNGGYIVLGAIIEKVSGQDYYAYVREHIFKPCGMRDTDSYARDAEVPNMARGYTRESEGGPWVLNHATLPGRGSSAGGGYSTAEDMLRYVRCLGSGKVYLPESVNGLRIAGGAPGINSQLHWNPGRKAVVVVLTNLDPPAAEDACRRIVSWLPE
ncbi:MAG: beta-lactamase family protein [Candidatus Aminicenantes bacterium]|nr:beta-lactamase family protein [Candidatus Aminicenantes bacterium]